jgi:5-methyltetrahydrofolate--homocysteine methyltransferase
MDIIKQIIECVIEGNPDAIGGLIETALTMKVPHDNIIYEGFVPGLNTIGERYSSGEIFLPEMLVAAMTVSAGMEILKPILTKDDTTTKGTVVVGTVVGDIHDIGKNIVCMMMKGNGFRVIDVGVDVPAEKYIQAAKESKADIIAMSALLSTTRMNMEGIIQRIRGSEIGKVKVMVGGAAVTQDFADSIGADGYAPDAGQAVRKAEELKGV